MSPSSSLNSLSLSPSSCILSSFFFYSIPIDSLQTLSINAVSQVINLFLIQKLPLCPVYTNINRLGSNTTVRRVKKWGPFLKITYFPPKFEPHPKLLTEIIYESIYSQSWLYHMRLTTFLKFLERSVSRCLDHSINLYGRCSEGVLVTRSSCVPQVDGDWWPGLQTNK